MAVCTRERTDLLEENGVFYLHPVVLGRRDAYPVGLKLLRGASVHLGDEAATRSSSMNECFEVLSKSDWTVQWYVAFHQYTRTSDINEKGNFSGFALPFSDDLRKHLLLLR